MDSRRTFAMPVAFAAALCLGAVASCRPTVAREERSPASMIESNVALMNATMRPEGSYAVVKGDTPRGIARKLGVDYILFSTTNGISENTPLEPGRVLIVPKVASRTGPPGAAVSGQPSSTVRTLTGPGKPPAAPAESSAPAAAKPQPSGQAGTAAVVTPTPPARGDDPVDATGRVRAVMAGTVAEVHRGYLSLGDVVIIESSAKGQKAVYAGSFTPAVAKGAAVQPGQTIGEQAKPGGVKVTLFGIARR